MSKTTKDDLIRSKMTERLNKIIEFEGLTQKDFAEKIDLSQTTMNYLCRGKKRVTEKTAMLINQAFPQYSADWILGNDDYPSKAAANAAAYEKLNFRLRAEFAAFDLYSQISGYEFIEPDNKDTGTVKIKKDGKPIASCSYDEYLELIEKIYQFALFEMAYLVRGKTRKKETITNDNKKEQ